MIEDLVSKHEVYKKEHLAKNRTVEAVACDLYIAVFKKCKGYIKVNKHEQYIRARFYDADDRRIRYGNSDMHEDAFLQVSIQQALTLVWDACNLPKNILVKKKRLPLRASVSSLVLPSSY